MILALAIISGFLTNLNAISAQAQFLELGNAQSSAVIGIAAAFVFCALMRRLLNPPSAKLRYAHYLAGAVGTVLLLLLAVGLVVESTDTSWVRFGAISCWLFLAVLFSEAFRLMLIELSNRHVNPAHIGSFYYTLILGYEIGTIGAATSIILTDFEHLAPYQVILCVIGVGTVFVTALLFGFGGFRNIEVRFSRRAVDAKQLLPLGASLFVPLLLMGGGVGLFRQFQDYQVRSVIKATAKSPEEIMNAILELYVFGSLITIVVSTALSRFSMKYRLSPFRVVAVGAVILACVQFYLFRAAGESGYIGMGAMARGIERGVYMPSVVLLMSFFVGAQRTPLRFWHHLMVLAASGGVFLLLSVIQLWTGTELIAPLSPWVTMLSMVLVFVTALSSQKKFAEFFRMNISGAKVPAILSATGLSYLRPRGYPDLMNQVLALNPKKLLRKTIILGLGFSRDQKASEIVIQEFQSEKEEIQLAVIDALSASRSYRGLNFILNVCLTGKSARSLSVRLNAATLVSSLYGKRAIPIIMMGLNDDDPRMVANALEALAMFREAELVPVFIKHLESEVPRVRANALMGLGLLKSYRARYQEEVMRALRGPVGTIQSSCIYVVGRVRDRTFLEELRRLEQETRTGSDPSLFQVRRMLAWALTCLGEPAGRALFWQLLSEKSASDSGAGGGADSILHFFSQLTQEERYDCVQHWLVEDMTSPEAIRERELKVATILKGSRFDFHFESEYAFDLSESLVELRDQRLGAYTPVSGV